MAVLCIPHMTNQITIEKMHEKKANDMPHQHFHPCYELYFLLSGRRRYFIGHTIFDVQPGDVVLIPPNELHQTTAPHNQGYDRYVVYFYEDVIQELLDSLGQDLVLSFFSKGCFMLSPELANDIQKSLEQIAGEENSQDRYSALIAKNLLLKILLNLFRNGTPKNSENSAGTHKIQDAACYISENYASSITLEEVAAIACLEKTYFSKQFKKLTGFGFYEYLLQTRIKAAEQLLQLTSLNMSEISEQCGFSGSNYFGDAFRKLKGMSPSQYRKLHKK